MQRRLAPPEAAEKILAQCVLIAAQKLDRRAVRHAGAQRLDRAAGRDRRASVHGANTILGSECVGPVSRTSGASGLSRPSGRTSSQIRIFRA